MTDTVTVRAEMKFKAWNVPNYATLDLPARPKQDGIQVLPTFPVKDLEPTVLDALAQTWLDQLYASANREPPFKKVGT